MDDYGVFYYNYPHIPCNMNTNMYGPCNLSNANRFVYVNQNFVNAGYTGTKVLINPNFKPSVHINPNFKKPVLKSVIHVNPQVLKKNEQNQQQPITTNDAIHKPKNKPFIFTRTKLVRTDSSGIKSNAAYNLMKKERQKSVHTKYKIVRTTSNNGSVKSENIKNECQLKNGFKEDKLIKSKYRLLNKTSSLVKGKNKLNRSKFISINGTLYKKTPNVLKKADLSRIKNNVDVKSGKGKILMVHGQIYKLDSNHRRLKLITAKKKCPNVFVKTDAIKKRQSSSQIRSRNIQILKNKMKKCNLPCPVYKKFGRCRSRENGTCIRVHNPNQVNLCTRFLQGACLDKNCLLSHKISPEKMPTCKYFLEGLCSKEDCPYLHVKISPKADICKDFLEGFCKNAKECNKRHQFLCPDYEKKKVCTRRQCPYPHGKVVRKYKFQSKVAKRIVKCDKTIKSKKTLKIKKSPTDKSDKHNMGCVEQNEKNLRYYIEKSNHIDEIKTLDKSIDEVELNDQNELSLETSTEMAAKSENEIVFKKRPQLGDLPSFIPFTKKKKMNN